MAGNRQEKDVQKAIAELRGQQEALKKALAGFEVTRVAHGVLNNALAGGSINFYEGSTDEIALRCIAIAKSLIVQCDLATRNAGDPGDTENAAEGLMVGAAKP